MNHRICFATAFYHAEGKAPNIKYSATSESKFDKYYRCIIVLFSTIRRFYRDERLILFSDRLISEKYNDLLDYYNIETIVIPHEKIKYVTNTKIHNKFPGCLFALDVLNYFEISDLKNDVDILYLLDSDVVMAKDITKFSKQLIMQDKISGLAIDYPIEKNTNGQSRYSLSQIYNTFNHSKISQEDFMYFGGEVLAVPSTQVSLLSKEIEELVQYISSDLEQYGNEFTEEHIFSLILNKIIDKVDLTDDLIKRVWTADSFSNIEGNEEEYRMLHLPAEKDRLFSKLFYLLLKDHKHLTALSNEDYSSLLLEPIVSRQNPPIGRLLTIIVKNIYNKIK